MSGPSDLQALFASIKPRPSPSQVTGTEAHPTSHTGPIVFQQRQPSFGGQAPFQSFQVPQPPQHSYNASVSSPIFSPGPANNPPHHSNDILSPNIPTPRQDQRPATSDQAASLLNLLKFKQATPVAASLSMGAGQSTDSPSQDAVVEPQPVHARTISASDLVASITGGSSELAATTSFSVVNNLSQRADHDGSAGGNAQEKLLRLLNRPQPSGKQTMASKQLPESGLPQPAPSSTSPPATHPSHPSPAPDAIHNVSPGGDDAGQNTPMHIFGSGAKSDTLPFEAPTPTPPKGGIFTYINPFEQLAAASPRNRTPRPKLKSRSVSPAIAATKSDNPFQESQRSIIAEAASAASAMNITSDFFSDSASQASRQSRSKSRSRQVKKETVSEAINALVGQLGQEVEDAFARIGEGDAARVPRNQDVPIAKQAGEVITELTDELDEEETKGTPDPLPNSITEAVNNVPDDVVNHGMADSWESAEDSAEKEEDRIVRVLNFPLRPFITINILPHSEKLLSLREDGIMDVARLKKDFDQLDRCLTSATADYIVYALPKNGGIRIIRQDDGSDKQIFKKSRDRIFHVALCASSSNIRPTKDQAVLGIGVSGAVYWTTISEGLQDFFDLDALDSESLIFPPYPASDENASGGQLKTRAKRSSRHADFFGIGRGKIIYIVAPHAALQGSYGVSSTQRTVDTEKFLKERALKISTGKAGKDFVFSDDDTVVASLDKTGRLRFWDISDMVESLAEASSLPGEIRTPLATFVTGSPSEKSWPTSVLFIDKLRPYVKSAALRYVLVGLKQNHTLQLWDIGLGRAVQEINFPHENESDAICSVAYHPSSGIIVVGHPTRNSIYFVHLSSPRYLLTPMSQASFIRRVNDKDGVFPKPESTACLSGIREISFASKGQLRSLDLLPATRDTSGQRSLEEESSLFELYVMHSHGVTCLTIKREDMGWTSDNKIIRPINAEEGGYIEVADLQSFPSYVNDEPSAIDDTSNQANSAKIAMKESAKKSSDSAAEVISSLTPSRIESPTRPPLKKKPGEDQSEVVSSGVDKPDKKKKKKESKAKSIVITPDPDADHESTVAGAVHVANESEELPGRQPSTQPIVSTAPESRFPGESINPGISGDLLKQMEKGVSNEVVRSLGRELDGLRNRFDEERRAWDAASAAKQDQVLRLVSSTLSDNVEKNLARIISQSIDSEVVPAIVNSTSSSLDKHVKDAVAKQLAIALPRDLRHALPEPISQAILQTEFLSAISETVGHKLTAYVEGEFSKSIHSVVVPTIKNVVNRTIEKLTLDFDRQLHTQMKQYEALHQSDSAKIDQLGHLVKNLSDTVASMVESQARLQNELSQLTRHLASRQDEETSRLSETHSSFNATYKGTAPLPRTVEENELNEIAQLMREGRYEEGSVKWLQSTQQADLFDNLFIRFNPGYLTSLSPIVSLSVGVAVSSSFQTNVAERLTWLETVFQAVNMRDTDIREVAPKIMGVLNQRLNTLYMSILQATPQDPIIRRIPPLSRRAHELLESR